jgi:drug/metabolite transporter (DMT)-like permease
MKNTNKRMKGILLMILCTLFTSFAVIFNKKGAMDFSWTIQGIFLNWGLIVGIVLLGLGFIVLSVALQYDEVSILYPIISLSFIWAYILSIFVYGELFGIKKLIGILVIIIGIIVLLKVDEKSNSENFKKKGHKK